MEFLQHLTQHCLVAWRPQRRDCHFRVNPDGRRDVQDDQPGIMLAGERKGPMEGDLGTLGEIRWVGNGPKT
jgi:hypothetical protein